MVEKRISRIDLYIETALLNSRRATCERGQVGAVLVRDKRIIASSYNGPPSGARKCQGGGESCDLTQTCTHAVHAEANLIAYCAKHGIATNDAIMVLTTCPCKKCSELIIQAGIKKVVFNSDYRLNEGLELLQNSGITIIKYTGTETFTDDFFI